MLRRPTLHELRTIPATTLVGVSAIAVSVTTWLQSSGHAGASPLLELAAMSERTFWARPWQLVTSALPHGDIIHLVFNVYWLATFGLVLEPAIGRWRMLGLFVLLSAGSAAGEFVWSGGGIGLSGVGYGLFGMLYVIGRRDPRWSGVVDRSTAILFTVWFFLCIVLTELKTWNVANVAHGAGAAIGALIGLASTSHRPRLCLAAAAGAVLLLIAGAPPVQRVIRPSLAAERLFRDGDAKLDAGDATGALADLTRADSLRPRHPGTAFALGRVHQKLEHFDEALTCYENALAFEPNSEAHEFDGVRKAIREIAHYLGELAVSESRDQDAARYFDRALAAPPPTADLWYSIGRMHHAARRNDRAIDAYRRAIELDTSHNPAIAAYELLTHQSPMLPD